MCFLKYNKHAFYHSIGSEPHITIHSSSFQAPARVSNNLQASSTVQMQAISDKTGRYGK